MKNSKFLNFCFVSFCGVLAFGTFNGSLISKTTATEYSKTVADDFKTTSVTNSNVFAYDNIVDMAHNDHPGLVGSAWGANITVGNNTIGYFAYKLEASTDKVLSDVLLEYNARICYGSKADLVDSKVSVYISNDGNTWGNSVSVNCADNDGTFKDYSVDLSSYLSGKASAYVKIEESIDSNYLNSYSDGTIPLAYCPIKISTISLKYNDKEPTIEPTTHDYEVKDYWGGDGKTQGTSIPNSKIYNATEVTNLGGDGNAVYGAVVGKWGAQVSAAEGDSATVIYKIGKTNQAITAASFNGKFRFWGANNDNVFNGDRILVDVSIDGTNYQNVEHVAHHNQSSDITKVYNDQNIDLSLNINLADYIAVIGKVQFIFIKVTMLHNLPYSAELGAWGMFLHNSGVTYSTKNCSTITYDVDGGVLPAAAQTCFFEDDSIYTLPTPTKEGFNFLGWFDGSNTVTTYDPSTKENLNVVAQWEILSNIHEITYYNTKGATNSNPVIYDENSVNIIELKPLFTIGYTFLGWFSEETGGTEVKSINPQIETTDIDLYGRWEEQSFDLTIEKDEFVSLTCNGEETIPTAIKYTDTFEFEFTFATGYELKNIKVNGALKDENFINDGCKFILLGSDCEDKIIAISSVKSGYVSKESAEFDFNSMKNGDASWKGNVFEQSNLRMISDQPNNTGLSIKETGNGVIVLKFEDKGNLTYNAITISGEARLFDFNKGQAGYQTVLKMYYSFDGEDYALLKEFKAKTIDSGDEMVNLATNKVFKEEVETVYLKIELQGAPGMDWAVIKSLNVEMDVNSILDEAKVEAKKALTNYIVNFDSSIKAQCQAIVDTAKGEIDNATSVNDVRIIVEDAKYDIDQVKLGFDKTKAKTDLDTHIFSWEDALLITVRPIVNSAKTAIDNATSSDEVAVIYAACISEIDAEKSAYDNAKALEQAKKDGIKNIDRIAEGVDMNKYSTENQTLINTLINNAKASMNAITTPSQADGIVSNLIEAISKVEVKKGCAGSIIGASTVVTLVMALGCVLLLKKKEN